MSDGISGQDYSRSLGAGLAAAWRLGIPRFLNCPRAAYPSPALDDLRGEGVRRAQSVSSNFSAACACGVKFSAGAQFTVLISRAAVSTNAPNAVAGTPLSRDTVFANSSDFAFAATAGHTICTAATHPSVEGGFGPKRFLIL